MRRMLGLAAVAVWLCGCATQTGGYYGGQGHWSGGDGYHAPPEVNQEHRGGWTWADPYGLGEAWPVQWAIPWVGWWDWGWGWGWSQEAHYLHRYGWPPVKSEERLYDTPASAGPACGRWIWDAAARSYVWTPCPGAPAAAGGP